MKHTLLLFFVAILAIPVASAQSPHELFQQALRLESSQGDLEGAIALYDRIGGAYGSDRALGARALFRMGQVYETLGQNQAERAYRRVVAEFADQTDTVGLAQQRLSLLAQGAATASDSETGGIRRVKVHPALSTWAPWAGSFSRDGKYFANVDWETVRIAYQEIGKDGLTYITPPNSDSLWSTPDDVAFSPDGRFIAYDWIDAEASYSLSLRVFDTETGKTRVVLDRAADPGSWVTMHDWSSDGESMLISTTEAGGAIRLALINAESGEAAEYFEMEDGNGYASCLMQDRYVLFEKTADAGNDIRRLDLATGREEPFLAEAANERLLGCSTARQVVLVRTDVFGDGQAWMYDVQDGRASGSPVYLADIGPDVQKVSITDTGDLLYFRATDEDARTSILYPYSVDEGRIMGRGEEFPRSVAQWSGPGWTRRGDKLAYRIGWTTMWVREQDGTTRTVDLGKWTGVYRWSADGTKFIASEQGEPDGTTYRLDAESGAVVDSVLGVYGSPGASGDAVLGVRRRDAQTVCVDEAASGSTAPRELICYPDEFEDRWRKYVVPSPDGRKLLVSGYRRAFVDLDARDVRHLPDDPLVDGKLRPMSAIWLPDESGVLMITRSGMLFRLPLAGGPAEPQLTQFGEVNLINWFALHPSGKQIVISSYPNDPKKGEPRELHIDAGAVERPGIRD